MLIALASLLVLLGYFAQGDTSVAAAMSTTVTTSGAGTGETTLDTTTAAPLVHPIIAPTRIVIPFIEVDAPVVPVGLLDEGDMETPHSGYAGWYSLGPAPGESGPALILAHVDTARRPDVFHYLKYLRPGDEILVYGYDENPAVFVVDEVEQELKVGLPRERIWDYSSESLIRLITCGGEWDRKTGHYLSNVIVYGHLVR